MLNKSTQIRLPAEWEPQAAVLLAWPHAASDWAPILEDICALYIELIRNIQRFESVIIVSPEPDQVAEQLAAAKISSNRIVLAEANTNDTWARDFGPLCIETDGQPLLLDFTFNGWGGKFAAELDNQINRALHAAGHFGTTPLKTVDLILEGGSIESNGQGTILTTSACLLNPNRNAQLDKDAVEQQLAQHFGADTIHWLGYGFLAGDDTDSHIDTLARLCPDDTIVYVACDDPKDEHYSELQKMAEQIKQLRTPSGKPYRLLKLPWPQAQYSAEGERLPATYANYLVINGAVLVPTYADPADDRALKIISQAYPEREIIGLDCRPVIWQHGSLHCLTMQIPQGVIT
jgi:agmatine deiminase